MTLAQHNTHTAFAVRRHVHCSAVAPCSVPNAARARTARVRGAPRPTWLTWPCVAQDVVGLTLLNNELYALCANYQMWMMDLITKGEWQVTSHCCSTSTIPREFYAAAVGPPQNPGFRTVILPGSPGYALHPSAQVP